MRIKIFYRMSLSLFLIAAMVGCSGGHDPSNVPAEEAEQIGFEIIELGAPPSLPFRAWVTPEITREEFEALELPPGWRKNQPREGDPDSSHFTRSPDTFVIQLFGGNTVIRTDNEDSFQGPVPELAALLP